MNNSLLFLGIALLDLSIVLFAWRLGKHWLMTTIVINIILTNVFVTKLIPVFGFVTTGAEIFYASIFLATDILSEHNGKKEGYKSIWMGFLAIIMFTVMARFVIMLVPAEESIAVSGAMTELFTSIPRIAIASLVAYLAAQSFDIWFYHWIKDRTSNRFLWLRNNISTISSQLLDSVVFFPLAFLGDLPMETIVTLVITGWLFKIPVAFIDTPFMYLSYYIIGKKPRGLINMNDAESPAAAMN